MQQAPATLKSKSHFEILDGLRGVAALMVVAFHTCEANNGGSRFRQIINHGYLGVDFFFLLSGFVVAYAYDDRWPRMTQWEFYKRRLIRLQPMVIMGSLIGATLFYLQRSHEFPKIAQTSVPHMLLVMLIGCTLIPLTPSMDIRGWNEMHPLNGPAWSLFFEYVANILYALGIRKLPKAALTVLVLLSAVLLFYVAVLGEGDVIGGWAVDGKELTIGFGRLLFPFTAGMLLMRLGKRVHIRHAFIVCSLLLILTFSLPRFGGHNHLWINGLYEFLVITLIFPIIVAAGAGDSVTGARAHQLCAFAGAISYPLYITHYPLIYIYTAWIANNPHLPVSERIVVGALLWCTAIAIAYTCLKLYDEPVRAWLTRRFLTRPAPVQP